MFTKILICLVLGYGFGCISTGYLVGKANKIDIRKYGSGNAGTTNALRTLGWKGVVLGHNFPFWLHFKGGKGIAATGGVILALDWRLAIVTLIVFLLIVIITRYVSLGSLVISTLLPIWIIIFYPGNLHMIIVSIIFTLSAFIKHRSNIKRLMSGTENKIGQKVKIDK